MYQSEKIILKPTITEHIPSIMQFEAENSDYVGQYSIEKHEEVINDPNARHFSIFEKTTNSLIGHIILFGINSPNDSIEFRRIVISKRGKGYGREAFRLIKKICFEEFHAHRIWLDVFIENHRAIKLYESEGFRKEGVARDCIKQKGKYRSMWIMSLLVGESEFVIPKNIDHVCLMVQDLTETRSYLEQIFGFEIREKSGYEKTLMVENEFVHFFVQQCNFPKEFLKEQHISFETGNLKSIVNHLKTNGINNFIQGSYNHFKHRNYNWIEWRDTNGIKFECIEKI